MSEFKKDPLELGVLWEKTGPNGTYFSGTVNGEKVVVFKNTKKSKETQPDWRILKSKPKEERPAKDDFGDAF